jgi:ribose transport system ATP-binding protein
VWLRPGAHRAIVPPNREREGNLPELTVRENLTIASLRRWRGGRLRRVLRLHAERSAAREMVASLSVLPGSIQATQRTLSGGNQQKVLFGRALLNEPDVLVLCEPTRGVDVGTRRQIYELMESLKARGCGLLIIASDPQDVLAVSNQIFLLDDGTFSADYKASDLSAAALARLV